MGGGGRAGWWRGVEVGGGGRGKATTAASVFGAGKRIKESTAHTNEFGETAVTESRRNNSK